MDLKVSIKKILRDFTLAVNFEVRDEIFALLGASGCGKSMTLKCIAGIETPDAGKIILDGRTLFDSTKKINLPPQARRAGFLFQNCALFPNMTVAENILFAATGDKISKLKENLSRFRLDGLENAYPSQLSGGQLQRVALARVLTSHAEFLLLDEPFSALDSHLKWQLELQLAEIFKLYGAAILVSHDRGEIFRLANSVAVMDAGKLDAQGSVREIFARPTTRAAAILTGCKNISAAKKISDQKIFAEDWQLELTAANVPDDLKFCAVHADAIQLRAADLNTFRLKISRVIEDTDLLIVLFEKNLRAEVPKLARKNFGGEVTLHFPPERILLLCR